jgi:hypothetical protein
VESPPGSLNGSARQVRAVLLSADSEVVLNRSADWLPSFSIGDASAFFMCGASERTLCGLSGVPPQAPRLPDVFPAIVRRSSHEFSSGLPHRNRTYLPNRK